jgi:hypothetical protein
MKLLLAFEMFMCVINGTGNTLLGTKLLNAQQMACRHIITGAVEKVTFICISALIVNLSSSFEKQGSRNLL